MNVLLIYTENTNWNKFCGLNWLINKTSIFYVFVRWNSIYINPNILLYIISKTCFYIEDSKPDLVHLLFHHVKYLLISQISQLWQVITFERTSFGISHLRQSSCNPMSFFVHEISEIHPVTQRISTLCAETLAHIINVSTWHSFVILEHRTDINYDQIHIMND